MDGWMVITLLTCLLKPPLCEFCRVKKGRGAGESDGRKSLEMPLDLYSVIGS